MKRVVALFALTMLATSAAWAQEHPEHPKPSSQAPPKESVDSVVAGAAAFDEVVTGENICLGCALKKEQGAAAQCDKYGHRHALKVTSSKVAGENSSEMQGWILHYLQNDLSQPYIEGHHAEKLTLKGKVYAAQRVFEVRP